MSRTLTQERLKQLLAYDPGSGVFVWRVSRGSVSAGRRAGTITDRGYVAIIADGRLYKAHRLAWLYTFGHFPSKQLDHVNGERDDNRLCNLREATNAENQQNLSADGCNSCGLRGVAKTKNGRFAATIRVSGKNRYLGTFDSAEDAHQAYLEGKARFHTFQSNLRP